MKKADGVIPKDATLAYSSTDDKDYGTAFDLFFTNANDVCLIDSCALWDSDCTTANAYGKPVWIDKDGKLKVKTNRLKGSVSNLCFKCTGTYDI